MSRPLVIALHCLGLLALDVAYAGNQDPRAEHVGVSSPDGRVRLDVSLEHSQKAARVPHYRVTFNGRPVVERSALQVDLADGSTLGSDCAIDGSRTRTVQIEFRQYPGKRSKVVDHCSEAVITFRERSKPARAWQLVARAYDDGVAFRYRFPAQPGWQSLELAGERTTFAVPSGASAYALPLNSFTTSHEKLYEKMPIAAVSENWLLGIPLLLELPGTGFAAITEANLTDYAGMYLARNGEKTTELISRLSPLPREPNLSVRSKLPHDSPWRVIMVADRVGRLVESDLLLCLNEPCALDDVSWIKSGKTTFPWWNGYYENKVPFKMGLNTDTAKYYIDFCAEAGIPYHSLDGVDNVAWYGGPIVPYEGADITKGIDGLDLPEVLRYAKSKGVRMRFWMHWQAARAHMARAFPLFQQWGVEGVMIDFMDRDDQEMVNFQRRVLRTALDNRLTVTFHGVAKPTGLERTYPNLLTSEGVLNLEYDKWDDHGVSPEHELTVPFTRMLAGPLDFHQGSFRGVTAEQFKPRNEAPLVIGTPCRTLASYVVFQNHLPMVADYPSAYRGHPALPVLAAIPTTWDDTRVLGGSVGEYVVIARRHGDDWWVGAMTNREARELTNSLGFLGKGRFRARIYRDDLTSRNGFSTESRQVGRDGEIKAKLEPAGGVLIHLGTGRE
jgi:alpha-glucosidase